MTSPLFQNLGLASGMPADPVPPGPGTGRIPLPDYKNPESRLAYAKAFREKYGKDVLSGYGDIPLRINEKPHWGSDTSKNLAVREASRLGLDPALFYASSMIEGQSGLYPQQNKETGEWRVNTTGDKDYPVSASWSFGLDSFPDYLPGLIKKGYLPADFNKTFKQYDKPGGPLGEDYDDENVMFKDTDSGIKAKAAMMRAYYDELDDYAKGKNVKLSPDQRNFFALAHFNSGKHGYEMMDAYNKAGLLKDDEFINKMPNIPIQAFNQFYKGNTAKAQALHKQIYNNVVPRIMAARGLKGEGYFDDQLPKQMAAPIAAKRN